jgi:hypothetical protein
MSFAIPVDYLGGHPEFDTPTSDGMLRIDEDSTVLTFLAAERVSSNPVVLAEQPVERFVVPVADLFAIHLEHEHEPAMDLLFGSIRHVFFGAPESVVDPDAERTSRLVVGAQFGGHRCRLLFLVARTRADEPLAPGRAPIVPRRAVAGRLVRCALLSRQHGLANVLRQIVARLDVHERALAVIIRRLRL